MFVVNIYEYIKKMKATSKKRRYPENLPLKQAVLDSGMSVKHLAKKISVSTVVLSNTINGNYKGTRIVSLLKQELGIN